MNFHFVIFRKIWWCRHFRRKFWKPFDAIFSFPLLLYRLRRTDSNLGIDSQVGFHSCCPEIVNRIIVFVWTKTGQSFRLNLIFVINQSANKKFLVRLAQEYLITFAIFNFYKRILWNELQASKYTFKLAKLLYSIPGDVKVSLISKKI